jgi:hypothetical protein
MRQGSSSLRHGSPRLGAGVPVLHRVLVRAVGPIQNSTLLLPIAVFGRASGLLRSRSRQIAPLRRQGRGKTRRKSSKEWRRTTENGALEQFSLPTSFVAGIASHQEFHKEPRKPGKEAGKIWKLGNTCVVLSDRTQAGRLAGHWRRCSDFPCVVSLPDSADNLLFVAFVSFCSICVRSPKGATSHRARAEVIRRGRPKRP